MSNSAYLTVRRYDGVTNSKEAARRVQEEFIPLISKLPGFISYYWVDEGDNVMEKLLPGKVEGRRLMAPPFLCHSQS